MQLKTTPYLDFKGNAREAMEFYKTIFGGKLELHTFADYHASQDPSEDLQIIHAALETDDGITFMAADRPSRIEDQVGKYRLGTNMSILLSGDNDGDAKLSSYFEKLSAGGIVAMPLEMASWGDKYGMLTDKFGVQWLVNITSPKV